MHNHLQSSLKSIKFIYFTLILYFYPFSLNKSFPKFYYRRTKVEENYEIQIHLKH